MSQRTGGDLSDMDVMLDSFDNTQSQSQDCEPSPPIPRHGSKTNFFSPSDSSTRTAYLLQQNKPWSPYGSAGPPTPRAPRAPLSSEERSVQQSSAHSPDGFPSWTFVNSPRSIRTPPRSLTSPIVTSDSYRAPRQQQSPSPGSPASLTPGQSPVTVKRHPGSATRKGQPLTTPHHVSGRISSRVVSHNISPQRKFASESELARAAADKANGNYEAARANQTADNIQELADMEHYWEEGSHRFQQVLDRSAYRSTRNRTGASPQGRRASEQLIKTPPDASPVKLHMMRPVSFVKALELTEQNYDKSGTSKKNDSHLRQCMNQQIKTAQSSNSDQDDRKSLYEMNYEISV